MKPIITALVAFGLLASTSVFAQQESQPSSQGASNSGQSASNDQQQQQQPSARLKRIQARLRQQGYYDGKITGKLDSDTRTALENFQDANGLQSTGQADRPTLMVLGVVPAGRMAGSQGAGGQEAGGMEYQGMGSQGMPEQERGHQAMGGQNAQTMSGSSEAPMGGGRIAAYHLGFRQGFREGLLAAQRLEQQQDQQGEQDQQDGQQ